MRCPGGTPLSESELQHKILLALGLRDDLIVWRSNAGVAFRPDGSAVQFGKVGQADITGIIKGGRRLEIEVKRPAWSAQRPGRQSAVQRIFQRNIEKMGGLYILAYSVEDVINALPDAPQ